MIKKFASSTGFSVTKYYSSYIIPCKSILKVFPWIDCTKDNMIFRLDKYLQKIKIFNKTWWNILAVCQKKAKRIIVIFLSKNRVYVFNIHLKNLGYRDKGLIHIGFTIFLNASWCRIIWIDCSINCFWSNVDWRWFLYI